MVVQGLTGLLSKGEEGEVLFAALMQKDQKKDDPSEMEVFMVYIWRQSISTNRYVREACMWLLEHLCEFWKPDSSMGEHLSAKPPVTSVRDLHFAWKLQMHWHDNSLNERHEVFNECTVLYRPLTARAMQQLSQHA